MAQSFDTARVNCSRSCDDGNVRSPPKRLHFARDALGHEQSLSVVRLVRTRAALASQYQTSSPAMSGSEGGANHVPSMEEMVGDRPYVVSAIS